MVYSSYPPRAHAFHELRVQRQRDHTSFSPAKWYSPIKSGWLLMIIMGDTSIFHVLLLLSPVIAVQPRHRHYRQRMLASLTSGQRRAAHLSHWPSSFNGKRQQDRCNPAPCELAFLVSQHTIIAIQPTKTIVGRVVQYQKLLCLSGHAVACLTCLLYGGLCLFTILLNASSQSCIHRFRVTKTELLLYIYRR